MGLVAELGEVAEEATHALSLAQTRRPHLILIDADLLGSDLPGFLAETTAEKPSPDCIVLVENQAQEVAGSVSGAGEVLWRGLPADQLLARVRARLEVHPV